MGKLTSTDRKKGSKKSDCYNLLLTTLLNYLKNYISSIKRCDLIFCKKLPTNIWQNKRIII